MFEFEAYIKKILDERGINEQDKEELYYEISDHLMLLKKEYVSKGVSEEEAVKASIKEFGNSNFIGNNIKRNLPSKNKYDDFLFRDKIICLLEMFGVYFLFICLFSAVTESLFFNICTAIVVTLTSFIFINKKLNNEKSKVKNLVICNASFFIIEKVIMSVYSIAALKIRGGAADSLGFIFKSFYIFNLTYISAFILLTIASVIVTKCMADALFKHIRNTYNYNLVSCILFVVSILLLFMYYLIPNRFYVLRKIIISIIGTDITSVSKNILYIVVNKGFVIPNIGLVLLIALCVRMILHIKKKGIGSIL